jgi:hypothetical protein
MKKLNAGDCATVPAEFMKWVFGGGVKLPGLVTRREAEGALISQWPSFCLMQGLPVLVDVLMCSRDDPCSVSTNRVRGEVMPPSH